MKQVEKQVEATDTCARCGLRRATRELEARGVFTVFATIATGARNRPPRTDHAT